MIRGFSPFVDGQILLGGITVEQTLTRVGYGRFILS
jgi:hypothetical protein